MAQGTNGAGCFRRELKNGRHADCESGWGKLRREHGKTSVDFPSGAAACQRIYSCQRAAIPSPSNLRLASTSKLSHFLVFPISAPHTVFVYFPIRYLTCTRSPSFTLSNWPCSV